MPFQTFLSYCNGRAVQPTANMLYTVDYTQYIPDCSETGPLVVAEISAPNWVHQYVIRLCGNGMEKITRKLPHIQIIFTKKGNKIVLKGPLKQVHIAEVFLRNLTASAQSATVVDDVRVDRKFYPHIVGKHGAIVKWITKETCTTIHIPSRVNTGLPLPPDVIRIQGHSMDVAAAKQIILQIVAVQVELYSIKAAPYEKIDNDPDAEMYRDVLHVDRKLLKHVIGRRGVTIKHIQYVTKTLMHVSLSTDEATIAIVGMKRKNVVKACEMITDVLYKMTIADYRLTSETSIPTDTTDGMETRQEEEKLPGHHETVTVNPRLFSRVIGRDCATIINFAEKHDVRILLPNAHARKSHNAGSITIVSSESKAKAAKDDLEEIIKKFEAQITEPVKIDPCVYRHLIGCKGRKIFDIQDEFHVAIWFPKPEESDLVTICGTRENVEKAKRLLLSLANRFMHIEAARSQRFGHAQSLCLRGFY